MKLGKIILVLGVSTIIHTRDASSHTSIEFICVVIFKVKELWAIQSIELHQFIVNYFKLVLLTFFDLSDHVDEYVVLVIE